MTPDNNVPPELRLTSLESDKLDNHTIEELSDYLDSGRTPPNPSIDNSPACQLALQSLSHLQDLSNSLLESEARKAPELSDSWVGRILSNIALDARAGRKIPLHHPSPQAELAITEGAVRGIIRAAESDLGDVIIGRSRLIGDVTVAGEPITVQVDASILWGRSIPAIAVRLREAITARLHKHTDLTIDGIDVTVHNVHQVPPKSGAGR